MPATASQEQLSAPTLTDLELVDVSIGADPRAQARFALPISAESESPNSVVYLEVDPGDRIPLHTHTAEEIFVVLQGTGIVTAGDRQWSASAGAIAVAPAFTKHGWENTGSETLRIVGFFGANVVVNEFEEPVAPLGVATFVTPIPQR